MSTIRKRAYVFRDEDLPDPPAEAPAEESPRRLPPIDEVSDTELDLDYVIPRNTDPVPDQRGEFNPSEELTPALLERFFGGPVRVQVPPPNRPTSADRRTLSLDDLRWFQDDAALVFLLSPDRDMRVLKMEPDGSARLLPEVSADEAKAAITTGSGVEVRPALDYPYVRRRFRRVTSAPPALFRAEVTEQIREFLSAGPQRQRTK